MKLLCSPLCFGRVSGKVCFRAVLGIVWILALCMMPTPSMAQNQQGGLKPLGGGGRPQINSQNSPANSNGTSGLQNDPDSILQGAPSGGIIDTSMSPESVDLLTQYEKSPTRPSLFHKILGLLGAGGSPSKQAAKAYTEGDYDQSLQKYAEAQLDNPESQALFYNIGNAQFRKKKYDDAIAAFKKALIGNDASIAAKSYYNLGNAEFRKGEFAIQSGKQEGIEDYREAMAHYKKSLEVAPDNKDAKRNIEVVQARIKELLDRQKQKQDQQQQQDNKQKPPEPSEKAKEILARAMQLVQERRYGEAKSLLENLIQQDATAATYQSHVQRIDDVMKILRGEQPTPPQSQDPRASQPGVGVI